jgi:hypothetical protein
MQAATITPRAAAAYDTDCRSSCASRGAGPPAVRAFSESVSPDTNACFIGGGGTDLLSRQISRADRVHANVPPRVRDHTEGAESDP